MPFLFYGHVKESMEDLHCVVNAGYLFIGRHGRPKTDKALHGRMLVD